MSYFTSLFERVKKNPASILAGPLNSPIAHWLKLDSLADSVFSPQVAESYINSQTGAGPTGVQLWQAEREDTGYQRAGADMDAAGLNRAMMYGRSAQPAPSNAGSGSSPASLSDLLELATLPARIKNLEANTARTNADTNRVIADTSNIEADTARIIQDTANKFVEGQRMEFDLNFLRDTRSLDIRAKELANNYSQAEFDKIYQWIDESIEKVNLMQSQELTEETKRIALGAEAILKYAQANEIGQLIEFKKLVMTSQANYNDASAGLAMAHTAWQNGLLDRNVLDALASQYFSDADTSEAKAAIATVSAALRNPTYGASGIAGNGFANYVISAMYAISDMLPFSGVAKF